MRWSLGGQCDCSVCGSGSWCAVQCRGCGSGQGVLGSGNGICCPAVRCPDESSKAVKFLVGRSNKVKVESKKSAVKLFIG